MIVYCAMYEIDRPSHRLCSNVYAKYLKLIHRVYLLQLALLWNDTLQLPFCYCQANIVKSPGRHCSLSFHCPGTHMWDKQYVPIVH